MKFHWVILLMMVPSIAVNQLSFSNQVISSTGSKFAVGTELGFVYRSASSLNLGLWLMDLGSTGSVPNLFQKKSAELILSSDSWLIRGLGAGHYELRIQDLRGALVFTEHVEILENRDFVFDAVSLPRAWYVIQLHGPQFFAKTVRH